MNPAISPLCCLCRVVSSKLREALLAGSVFGSSPFATAVLSGWICKSARAITGKDGSVMPGVYSSGAADYRKSCADLTDWVDGETVAMKR